MSKELRERGSTPSNVTNLTVTKRKEMNVSPSPQDYELKRQIIKERSHRILESRGNLYSDSSPCTDEEKESDVSSYEPPIDTKNVNPSNDLMDFFDSIGTIPIQQKMNACSMTNRTKGTKKIMDISDASSVPTNKLAFEIDQWIETVRINHTEKSSNESSSKFMYKNAMPSLDEMLKCFPEEMRISIQKKKEEEDGVDFANALDPSLDVSLLEYIQIIGSILDVPIREGHLIESVHCFFQAYLIIQSKEDQEEDEYDEMGGF